MNKLENLGTTNFYSIICNSTNNFYIIKTKSNINKFISNQKTNNNKNSALKTLLLSDNFKTVFLKGYDNLNLNQLKNELIFWEKHFSQIQTKNEQTKIDLETKEDDKITSHNKQYQIDYNNGVEKEIQLQPTFNRIFNDVLIETGRYSKVDFIGKKMLYELKTFKGNFGDYPNVLLGINKIISENLVVVFCFGNNDLYFIRVNFNLFSTFNTGFIKKSTRLYKNEVVYIPNEFLTKIDNNKTYSFDEVKSESEIKTRNNIIKNDMIN